jgi:hypothetical protein
MVTEHKQTNICITGYACVKRTCPRVGHKLYEWPKTVRSRVVFELSAWAQIEIIGPVPPADFICKGRLNMTTCSPFFQPARGPSSPKWKLGARYPVQSLPQ